MEMDAQLMEIEPESPVLIQYGTFYTRDEMPIMTGRMVYPANRVEIIYEVKENNDTQLNLIHNM
jgi:DNA-binding GntR family transcriptional regulator